MRVILTLLARGGGITCLCPSTPPLRVAVPLWPKGHAFGSPCREE